MEKIVFSTILYVDHDDLLPEALEQLNQCDLFPEQGQLIVVDPHSSDAVIAACAALHNCVYFPLPGAELPAAYNLGLKQAKGQYINFTLASSRYSPDFYAMGQKALKEESVDMVSANPAFVSPEGIQTQYSGTCEPSQVSRVMDLSFCEANVQLLLQAYLFRRELLKDRRFEESLHEDALFRLLMELQLDEPRYLLMGSSVQYLYTVAREDDTSTNPLQYYPWWYSDSINHCIIPLLQGAKERFGRIPGFLQIACFYQIYHKFNCNLNDRSKGVVSGKEQVKSFANDAFNALTLIDNQIISKQKITPCCKGNRGLRMFFFRGRAAALNQNYHMVNGGYNRFTAVIDTPAGDEDYANHVSVFGAMNKEVLRITVMNVEDNMLVIDAAPGLVDYLNPEEFRILAIAQNPDTNQETIYEATATSAYPLVKCFGITYHRKYPVQFRIPAVSALKLDIAFYYEFQNRRYPLTFTFGGGNSRLNPKTSKAYWMFRDHWMLRWSKASHGNPAMLRIRKVRRLTHIKWELSLDKAILRLNRNSKAFGWHIVLTRWLYWLLLPFYRKKHVWVTFDKLYKAGDNGEYMYQYLREHAPEVDPYYIIRRESPDYERLAKQDRKHTLVFGTLRCTLISLMADIYLDTHANIPAQFNPTPEWRPYTKDLQRGEVVCIQHGLTIQEIAQFQNRLFDNIKLYCCASPYEIQNLSHPFYDYRPEQLKLTGLARYDGLKSRDRKIILITPSWRKNVVNSSVANKKKTHNSNFKNSDYFRIYNRLINDQTLIDCAKRSGYRVIYLLHPAMSAQLEDFDRNDYVELIPATGDMSYEKILCESSLMVTDYSGVQFDFAYMRKPILYYHPDALPPHYDEGGMSYATQGFGPICTTHEQIVSALCDAMERGCTTQEEYIRRADDFFAYDDHNNCQRIYDAVHGWLEETK